MLNWSHISDTAVAKICYGEDRSIANLKSFLTGGTTWPREDKYECPAAPVTFRPMRWAAGGAGRYPDTFGRTTVAGELVSTDDLVAAANVGAGLTPDQLIAYGWWEPAQLVWGAGGAGMYHIRSHNRGGGAGDRR